MARVIACISAYQAELRAAPPPASAADFPECPYVPLNFGVVRGGTANNMIADRCTLSISYRPLPDGDPRAVHARSCAVSRRRISATPARPTSPARIEVGDAGGRRRHALAARHDARVGAAARRSAATRSGGAPFATDGGELERGGIASLICGPGELEQAHQPNESMPRAAFEDGVEVIRAIVARLCAS